MAYTIVRSRTFVAVVSLLAAACAEAPKDAQELAIPNVEPNGAEDSGTGGGGGGSSSDGGARDASTANGDASVVRDASTGNDASTGTDASTGSDASTGTDASTGNDASTGSDSGTCATVPPNNLCGLVPQCGCGANQTCDVTNDTTGATSCITSGATARGAQCTGTGNCAQGLTCVFGACRPYCTTPNQACPGTGLGGCYSPEYAAGLTTPNRNVCAIDCDPRTPSAACGNNSCLWFAGSNGTDCRPGGTGLELDACSTLDGCAAGLICFSHPLFGPECERWCRLPASSYPNDCGAFTTCTDAYAAAGANAPFVGGVKLGLCQ